MITKDTGAVHLAVPAARFCQKELSNDAFVLFEPNIADGDLQGKRGGPVEFPTRTGSGKKLSFTGRVDYVLSAGKLQVGPDKLTNTRNLAEFWDRATAMSESDAPAGLLGLLAKEAKKLMPRKELFTHLPQVILETMATSHVTGVDIVPWILTDGIHWIFGILWREDDDEIDKWECRYFESYDLLPGEGHNLDRERVKIVVALIVYWMSAPRKELKDMFEEAATE
ncbi:hypothetical protein CC2G_004161 [Coprinopsis cinerea AmutBmut pab1-1]|nr:hypothetical protein CC2G_004161 [Coprinopsis cinerea AmutBmut pab1-1]